MATGQSRVRLRLQYFAIPHVPDPGASVRRVVAIVLLSLFASGAAFAGQDEQGSGMVVQNPLDEIRDALASTLEQSGMPFTEAQVQAIALVMDEQRRASEELFGQVLDFSAGPPQGAQLDQGSWI